MAYTHQESTPNETDPSHLPRPTPLDDRIISRAVDTSPLGLNFHILECLPPSPPKSCPVKLILLVHGFPDLAYSWRKVLPLLADQGYHAVAYDLRGFGRTFSRRPLTEKDFRPAALITDALALVSALGYESVEAIVGHDFGAVTATLCTLARPDIFKGLVLISHPINGPFILPYGISISQGQQHPERKGRKATDDINIFEGLARLQPARKHYQRYYCAKTANAEMSYPQGPELKTFLRGYFHLKSADWGGNNPYRLGAASAEQFASMPDYYIMPADKTMRETVADMMTDKEVAVAQQVAARWLDDAELGFYADEWSRTTFRGGLNWYGLSIRPDVLADAYIWTGRKISVPTAFVSGRQDWGSFQDPGALEALETGRFVERGMYRGTVMVEGAGHWLNQEQPGACAAEILKLVGAGV